MADEETHHFLDSFLKSITTKEKWYHRKVAAAQNLQVQEEQSWEPLLCNAFIESVDYGAKKHKEIKRKRQYELDIKIKKNLRPETWTLDNIPDKEILKGRGSFQLPLATGSSSTDNESLEMLEEKPSSLFDKAGYPHANMKSSLMNSLERQDNNAHLADQDIFNCPRSIPSEYLISDFKTTESMSTGAELDNRQNMPKEIKSEESNGISAESSTCISSLIQYDVDKSLTDKDLSEEKPSSLFDEAASPCVSIGKNDHQDNLFDENSFSESVSNMPAPINNKEMASNHIQQDLNHFGKAEDTTMEIHDEVTERINSIPNTVPIISDTTPSSEPHTRKSSVEKETVEFNQTQQQSTDPIKLPTSGEILSKPNSILSPEATEHSYQTMSSHPGDISYATPNSPQSVDDIFNHERPTPERHISSGLETTDSMDMDAENRQTTLEKIKVKEEEDIIDLTSSTYTSSSNQIHETTKSLIHGKEIFTKALKAMHCDIIKDTSHTLPSVKYSAPEASEETLEETKRLHDEHERIGKEKSAREIESSKWTLAYISCHVTMENVNIVDKLTDECVIPAAEREFSYLRIQLENALQIESVAMGEIPVQDASCFSYLHHKSTKEAMVKLFMNHVIEMICVKMNLTVHHEYALSDKTHFHISPKCDYVLESKGKIIASVELKAPQAMNKNCMAPLMVQLLKIQYYHQDPRAKYLGVLTDGYKHVLIFLQGNTFTFEREVNNRKEIVKIHKARTWSDTKDIVHVLCETIKECTHPQDMTSQGDEKDVTDVDLMENTDQIWEGATGQGHGIINNKKADKRNRRTMVGVCKDERQLTLEVKNDLSSNKNSKKMKLEKSKIEYDTIVID